MRSARSLPFQAVLLTTVGFAALCASGAIAHAQFKQTNLASDISGLQSLNLKTASRGTEQWYKER